MSPFYVFKLVAGYTENANRNCTQFTLTIVRSQL
ncbi:hypothetical protein LP7551_00364 [Roseibium album]|nr:hypothetical protein LP7551_00364 [Roseibium album]